MPSDIDRSGIHRDRHDTHSQQLGLVRRASRQLVCRWSRMPRSLGTNGSVSTRHEIPTVNLTDPKGVVDMPVKAPDSEVIRDAVMLASRAPSLHNSQPWRWVVEGT